MSLLTYVCYLTGQAMSLLSSSEYALLPPGMQYAIPKTLYEF